MSIWSRDIRILLAVLLARLTAKRKDLIVMRTDVNAVGVLLALRNIYPLEVCAPSVAPARMQFAIIIRYQSSRMEVALLS